MAEARNGALDSVDGEILDSSFDSHGISDEDGFEALDRITNKHPNAKTQSDVTASNTLKLVGGGRINKTIMLPMTLYTDAYTAEQTILLLDMIRFCMEKSSEGRSDDVKEFTINLHIKNRSNSDFIVSIGDEAQEPIAYDNDVFIGH